MKLQKIRKQARVFIFYRIISSIAQIVYFTGLTLLLPILPFVLSPAEFVRARWTFALAIFWIFLSFLIIYFFTSSKKQALRNLGFMTIIPGFIAVIFSFLGKQRTAELLSQASRISLVTSWIEAYVPSAWMLAGVYIILGCVLWYLSEKLKD